MDEMVMRSVYLRPGDDSQLRQLAHELNVTKSDLIRSAISVKLREWLECNTDELVVKDLAFGRRDSSPARIGADTPDPQPKKQSVQSDPSSSRKLKAKRPASSERRRQAIGSTI